MGTPLCASPALFGFMLSDESAHDDSSEMSFPRERIDNSVSLPAQSIRICFLLTTAGIHRTRDSTRRHTASVTPPQVCALSLESERIQGEKPGQVDLCPCASPAAAGGLTRRVQRVQPQSFLSKNLTLQTCGLHGDNRPI